MRDMFLSEGETEKAERSGISLVIGKKEGNWVGILNWKRNN